MTDYGATDTSTTSLGANQFPTSSVWIPNGALTTVMGGPSLTDGGSKKSAPVIEMSWLTAMVIQGQAFMATTWRATAGSNGSDGLSVFNPSSSGKNVLVYSALVYNGGYTPSGVLNLTTTDPAFAHTCTSGSQLANMKAGGAASAIASSVTYSTNDSVNLGSTGVLYPLVYQTPNGQGTIELLGSIGKAILLPSGSNNGVMIGTSVQSGQGWGITASWIEY